MTQYYKQDANGEMVIDIGKYVEENQKEEEERQEEVGELIPSDPDPKPPSEIKKKQLTKQPSVFMEMARDVIVMDQKNELATAAVVKGQNEQEGQKELDLAQ